MPAPARADASPQIDLALLNQERAAWGLPAGIAENPTWSADCAAHDNYERENGGGLTHQEGAGNPGYTSGGAYAGSNSILSEGTPWTAGNNPFETAPIHLIQLFTPSLASVGIDDSSGYVCVTTWPGMDAAPPAAETVSTYPGDATTGFLTSEDAAEGPFVPGDFVGIPQGTTAGQEIFVYLDEPGHSGPAQVQIESASLTAPSGPLDIRTVDNTTGTIGPYLTGGIIIPVQPLPEGVPITASVTLAGQSGPITHQWTFTTARSPGATVTVDGTTLTFTSASPAQGLLRVFIPPESNSYYILNQPVAAGTSALDTSRLPTDTSLVACVSQPADAGFDPSDACSQPFTLSDASTGGGKTGIGGGTSRTGGETTGTGGGTTGTGGGTTGTGGGTAGSRTYGIALSLQGRRVTIRRLPQLMSGKRLNIGATYQRRACRHGHCRLRVIASRRRTLVIAGASSSIVLPRVRGASRLSVTVSMTPFWSLGRLIKLTPTSISGRL